MRPHSGLGRTTHGRPAARQHSTRFSNNSIALGVVGLLFVVGVLGVFALRWYSVQVPDPSVHSAAAGPPIQNQTSASAQRAEPAGVVRPPLEQQFPQLAARLGTVVERDDFSGPSGLFLDPPPGQPGRVAYEDGGLVLEYQRGSSDPLSVIGVAAGRPASFTNGVVAVDARLAAGGSQAGFAIMFRRSEDNQDGYALWVRPRGSTLQLLKQHGGERSELAQVQTDALDPNGSNQVTLVADGETFQVFVNGQAALTAQDAGFASGRLGLAAGLIPGGPPGEVRVRFDDFQLINLR